MCDFGLALKILRKRFSLTQAELAEKVGVSNHAVSKWENGINQPDVSMLQSICKMFDITVDDFLRLAEGESEESVFGKEEVVEDYEQKPKSFNYKILIMIISAVLALGLIICGISIAMGGSNESESETESEIVSVPEIGESLELGDEISGSKDEFLSVINDAITLGDGVSEYDIVGNLKTGNQGSSITSFKVVIDKKNGAIERFYVYSPMEDIDAYSDFEYVYTTRFDQKVRLDKNAIDLLDYITDIEELYNADDILQIKAYKKGYTTQYVFSFTEDYALNELEEFMEQLDGAFLNDCQGVLVISNGGMSEKISLNFTYKGTEYEFVATRQLNYNSTFEFPDFSEYQDVENVSDSCAEINDLISATKNLTTYSKTLSRNGNTTYSIEKSGVSSNIKAKSTLYSETIYYANGKTYAISSNYEGSYPYYKKESFDSFYALATKRVDYKNLLELNFELESSHVETIIKQEEGNKTKHILYLTPDGIEYFKEQFDLYLYVYGTVELIFTEKESKIENIEIVDKNGDTFALNIVFNASITLPDFSEYGAISDGTNVITSATHSTPNEWEFNAEAFVDVQTGDVYTLDGVRLKKYNKNHVLVKEYELYRTVNNWTIGRILGITGNRLYYSLFDGYYCDIDEDNKVCYVDLTTGASDWVSSNYDRTQMPVAYINGIVFYEKYHRGLEDYIPTDLSSTGFLHYDNANNLIVFCGILNGECYVSTYNVNTYVCLKETTDGLISEEYLCGEGYYDQDGKYCPFVQIGKAKSGENYFKVVDRHPDRDYYSDIGANWQIVKDTSKYTFTTYGVYEKSTGNFAYFPYKAEYRFFNGGVHVWEFEVDVLESEKNWYTFYF